jgi:hypothetical protein
MRWTGHVVRIEKNKDAVRILVRKPEGKNHWKDQNIGAWIILKSIFET